MGAPILFIHYGPAYYLRWTFERARISNPEKRIVLLGDATNKQFARGVAEFIDFESLAGTQKELEFQRVFQVIQGSRHRFNKEREGLDAFWTFDSDTLVLANLCEREGHFSDFEATTQCNDQCLNGWVGSRSLVSRYTQSILDQFSDEAYLHAQRERLRANAGLSFNEMDAFAEFRRRESVKTWHGEKPIGGEIFDDALAFTEGFELAPEKVLGKTATKRLWTNGKSIFVRRAASQEFVRLLTCNMSWIPDYMWRRIMAVAKGGGKGLRMSNLIEFSTAEPVIDRLFRKTKMLIWKLRRKF